MDGDESHNAYVGPLNHGQIVADDHLRAGIVANGVTIYELRVGQGCVDELLVFLLPVGPGTTDVVAFGNAAEQSDFHKQFYLLLELFRFYSRLLHNCQKRPDWQGFIAAMQRHRYNLPGFAAAKNHVAPSLSGKHKTVRLKNLDDLPSGQCFHAGSSESDFYVCDYRALFALRNSFMFGLKFFNPKA
jgi:hypothetical protein